jgi:hypothetical protein
MFNTKHGDTKIKAQTKQTVSCYILLTGKTGYNFNCVRETNFAERIWLKQQN